jgi:hypothetical protein
MKTQIVVPAEQVDRMVAQFISMEVAAGHGAQEGDQRRCRVGHDRRPGDAAPVLRARAALICMIEHNIAGGEQVSDRPGLPDTFLSLYGEVPEDVVGILAQSLRWHGLRADDQATKEKQEEAGPILRRLDPSPGRQPALQHPGPAQGEPQYP